MAGSYFGQGSSPSSFSPSHSELKVLLSRLVTAKAWRVRNSASSNLLPQVFGYGLCPQQRRTPATHSARTQEKILPSLAGLGNGFDTNDAELKMYRAMGTGFVLLDLT